MWPPLLPADGCSAGHCRLALDRGYPESGLAKGRAAKAGIGCSLFFMPSCGFPAVFKVIAFRVLLLKILGVLFNKSVDPGVSVFAGNVANV